MPKEIKKKKGDNSADQTRILNLVEWGFSFFASLSRSIQIDSDSVVRDGLIDWPIPSTEYQLIEQLMRVDKKEIGREAFRRDEIQLLFQLGNKYRVEGLGRENIFILMVDCLSSSNDAIDLSGKLRGCKLWREFEIFFNSLNNGITLNKSAILLDGLVFDPEKMKSSFLLLKNFSSFCNQIELRNMLLDSVVIEALQSCLSPHLSALHLIDCPLNTTVCLNLSHLKQLTSFQCSNCYADQNLIQILDGVGENLVHLDISNNQLNPGEGQRLIEIIEKQSSLFTLNICGNNILPKSIPELFTTLFMLPALTSVDLSSNPIGPEFIRNLNDHFSVLYWTFLNLSNCCISDKNLKLFLNNFYKLPELHFLNISNNWIVDYPSSFCQNIKQLLSLDKITLGPVSIESFEFPIDEILQIHSKLDFVCPFEMNPESQKELLLMKRVNLKSLDKLLHCNSSIDFPNVEHAKFDFIEFPSIDPIAAFGFFAKFTHLTSVELFYFDKKSFEFILKIFQQNKIKNLIVSIGYGFNNIAQLFQLIDCCPDLISFSLTKCCEIDEECYLVGMKERNGSGGSWKNLKRLSFSSFSYNFICTVLSTLYLPNLTEFKIYNLILDESKNSKSRFIFIPFKSVQSVSLFVNEWKVSYSCSCINNLLSLFPMATHLELFLKTNSRIKIPIAQLMPRLKSLSVYIYRMTGQEFICELINLKQLSNLTFEYCFYYPNNSTIKQSLCFPTLCQLKTYKPVFDSSNWVLPWLRKATFQQCFSLPRLDKLSRFGLLKELILEDCTTEMLANLFTPSLFNHLFYLNIIKIAYDSETSEIFEIIPTTDPLISQSLVQLTMQFHETFIRQQMMNGDFPFLFVINNKLFIN